MFPSKFEEGTNVDAETIELNRVAQINNFPFNDERRTEKNRHQLIFWMSNISENN